MPGTYGLVIGLGAEQSMRVVVSYQTLPGGYRLLMGRESVRFQSLVERFWYGIAGAVAIVLVLGGLRLAAASFPSPEIDEISRNAAAIVDGDLSRRLPRTAAAELDALAQTVNGMLEQLHGALQRQTKYLDELFELAPDAIVLTEMNPSRIVRVNREFTRMFGYTAEEAVGRSLRELIAPGELTAEYARNADAIAAGDKVDLDLVRVRKDGTRLHVHFTSAQIKTEDGKRAAYLIYRDITERKLAADAVRASEARFRSLTELSSDWYWEQDENLRFTYLSSQVEALTGYSAESSLGKHRWEIANTTPLSCSWPEHQAVLAARQPFRDLETRRVGPDGRIHYLSVSGAPIFDEQGRFKGYRGIGRNITERKRIEDALRLSEERYALALEASEEGHFDTDLETGEIFVSARLNEIYGFPRRAKTSNRVEFLKQIPFHPDDRHWLADIISADWDDPAQVSRMERYSARIVPRPGETRWIQTRAMVTRDAQGRARRRVGVVADITERKLAEEARRLSEERYALAMEAAGDGHTDWNLQTGEHYISPRLLQICGHAPDTTFRDREEWVRRFPFHPEDRPKWEGAVAAHLAGRESNFKMELRIVVRGEVRWTAFHFLSTRDAAGTPMRWSGSIADITEQKRAEEELRRSQHYLAEAQRLSHIGSWAFNAAGFGHWSPELFKIHGLDPGGKAPSIPEYVALVHPEDRDFVAQEIEKLLAGAPGFDFKKRIVRPDGAIRLVRCVGIRATTDGIVQEFVGSGMDVTEQERAEEELRKSEERFAMAVAGSNEGIFDWDLVSDRVYVSHRAQELFGLPRGELWRPRRDWRHILSFHPDDAPRLHDSIKAHIQGSAPTYDVEFRIVLPGGGVRWFRQRGIALRDASGKAYRVVGSIGDVTEKHKAEEDLRSLERQLRLAQRLEAMGTLAGGIAHDFNNILGAILGYGEMALRDAPKGSRLARDLDSIVVAGERGRALVDRVLAFSRSAVGERVPVHVEKVVREALDLLSAKLPPNVTLHAKLHSGSAAMLGDATQVHQVVTNLVTNAVHAMPAGGTLRVSLSAARIDAPRTPALGTMPAGDCLILEVADSGTGIAPEILDRIFDPFFTTKDVGTGTGLGLSLVHGIVTELGGAIDVASTPGEGSTFTVYVPRSGDALDSSQKEEPELPRGDGQRVLVVDDEEPLVRLATRTLEELGYVATGFTSSAAALSAFRADPQRFDALITDERMPGMSGSRLIREVRGIRGGIPVVLMSGYVGGPVSVRARAAGAEEVLQKPLSARDLAASLARVLHS